MKKAARGRARDHDADAGRRLGARGGRARRRPGVRSARFAHERATDAENNAALLAALDALGDPPEPPGFRARFRCVLALVDPFTGGGEPRMVEGVCEGTVTRTPRGSGGFGYDPLFVVDRHRTTMAELERGREEPREPPRPAPSPRSGPCSSVSSRSAPSKWRVLG